MTPLFVQILKTSPGLNIYANHKQVKTVIDRTWMKKIWYVLLIVHKHRYKQISKKQMQVLLPLHTSCYLRFYFLYIVSSFFKRIN